MSKIILKVHLVAFALATIVALCGNAYYYAFANGVETAATSIDNDSMQAYVHFAKPYQAAIKHAHLHSHAKADDVFAKAGF